MSKLQDKLKVPTPEVNLGENHNSPVNNIAINRYVETDRFAFTPEQFIDSIRNGNRAILSKAITIIESSLKEHQILGQKLIEQSLPFSGNSIRIGITGIPGVGKSTFIEAFGKYLTSLGHKIAVLAIDPSSTLSKGSILGDKTRMEELAGDSNAFIRPSPSSGSLGGVARKTHETIILCEAAGYDTVLIETVGVGQSETAVHSMVDFFLLLMLVGTGDELQGIKKGILEMADAIIINKADGDNLPKVNSALADLQNSLKIMHPSESGWQPIVSSCSALKKTGISDLWTIIENYVKFTKENGYFDIRRLRQSKHLMHHSIEQSLQYQFYNQPVIKDLIHIYEEKLNMGQITAYVAAGNLLEAYNKIKMHQE